MIVSVKTDLFRQGIDLNLGATSGTLKLYCLTYQSDQSSLIAHSLFSRWSPFTRQRFSNILNTSLAKLGYNSALHNTHSFRIGAATTARQANIPDLSIQMLGRWKTNAYQTYIKTPPQELARFSAYLTTRYQQATEANN